MKNRRLIIISIIFDVIVLIVVGIWFLFFFRAQPFDGQRAYKDVEYQVSLGARLPDSQPHAQVRAWIKSQLTQAGWEVIEEKSEMMGHTIYNITAQRGTGKAPIIIGAHYDSRMLANKDTDPNQQTRPVPGANDGASGVAVLLELARDLPADLNQDIWLAFFDAEDQGSIPGWDWILGSRVYAGQLTITPRAVVVIDMIGDKDLNIYYEKNSNAKVMKEIWDEAAAAGFGDNFIPTYRFNMEDDHTPFLEKGIPAVDIIDFDYPYWHTTQDTADKVSSESLSAVGNTLYRWITSRR
jgi:glutaminyl-peptide cyclotransferase